ncbi:DUF3237 domain-containing protein [Salinicoccus roseus]|uniref:UPF0311 protein F7P68_0009965 n=2 Tax=Salinicoccus roseus TaxID=45670 RepID=A0ABT4YJI7_9STAP|nr:DUF3237 domain-containing protein [Salinicoccus roseus]MDB0580859.1 DUF3237 domain-containing protein [Salinicoccus roseus]
MRELPQPKLELLGHMELSVAKPHLPGQTPIGRRRIIQVTGGKFEGEYFNATVLPGGDDWITVREDGTIIQDVRITLETDDNEIILMTYRGIRTGPQEVLDRLDQGENVDPEEYYFRTNPVFETASEKYHWLNNRIFVSNGIRLPEGVSYSIYTVK